MLTRVAEASRHRIYLPGDGLNRHAVIETKRVFPPARSQSVSSANSPRNAREICYPPTV